MEDYDYEDDLSSSGTAYQVSIFSNFQIATEMSFPKAPSRPATLAK